MLVIFDVDGTLIGGEAVDWKCFGEALEEVSGFICTESFWTGLTEVTAKAIVYQALPNRPSEERPQLEEAVRIKFLEKLRTAHTIDPLSFQPTPGATSLLEHLRVQPGIDIALATGDWTETVTFKLAAAGFDTSAIPLATSSDCYARADIIRLAAQRANRDLTETIYIGDGLWDLKACEKLGIPFLGVGHRHPQFVKAGAIHLLHTLELHLFEPWFTQFRQGQRPKLPL